MAIRRSTMKLGKLDRRADVVPDSLDAEKRTVDVVWTTGARVLRMPWFDEPYYEELSVEPKAVRLDRLNGGAPLLDSHDGYDLSGVLGAVERGTAKVDGKQGTATVRFPKPGTDPNSDRVFALVEQGIVRSISVGYRVHKMERVSDRIAEVPVMRATDWEPMELSLVPMPADAGAGVRAARAEVNECEVVEDDPTEERVMAKEHDPKGSNGTPAPAAAAAAPDSEAIGREAAKVERERIAEIRRMGALLKRDEAEIQQAIDGDVPAATFTREAAIRAEKAQGTTIPAPTDVVVGRTGGERFGADVTAHLLCRAGVAHVVEAAAKKYGRTEVYSQPAEMSGMSLARLAEYYLQLQGVRTIGMDPVRMVEAAFKRAGAQGTSDFAVGLENALNKTLLGAYATAPDTWRAWCKAGSVTSFREHKRYRLGSIAKLPALNEHGEIQNLSIPDAEAQGISADTVGAIIALTRKAIVNDDMGMFSDVAMAIGRAAARTIEIAVYAQLGQNSGLGPTMADTHPFFHSAHGNVGTSGAISAVSIDKDRQTMAEQLDPSGNDFLDLRPVTLLVPLALGSTARLLNLSQYDPAASVAGIPNVVAGLYRQVVDTPRITWSTTRRYSFADPAEAAAVEVAFLNGNQQPQLRMQEGWRNDGVEWRAVHDFGVAFLDVRAAVTNAGT